MFLLFLVVVISFGIYVMEPEERTGALRAVVRGARRAAVLAHRVLPDCGPAGETLRTRTRWASVTLALAVVIILVFLRMLVGQGALSDPATLVSWGGNVGTRTTNAEWWRLVSTMFVHGGVLQLLITVAALVQVGTILERLVGHTTFALVFFLSGIFASITSLYVYPMVVNVGAAPAVFGIYGLLATAAGWGFLRRSGLTIPGKVLLQLAPVALIFFVYNLVAGTPGSEPELTGLVMGLAAGAGLTRQVTERKPPLRELGIAFGAALLIAIAGAFPLRGVADVRPEIERIVALEDKTAGTYEAAVGQFRLGAMKAEALAQLIERTIVPELHAAQGRLKAFETGNVPLEHRPIVTDASEYLRLRDESWRLRAEALRKANMGALRKADRTEWASLEVLKKIQPASQQ